jgi:ABC-type multidrug transport system ATPase subunit
MPEPAIVVKDLRFAYGDHLAVDGVSFEVMPGEIVGFLGPNGAGKSTTIKMLTGQLQPSAGTVTLLGHDGVKERARVQPEVGVAFEEKNLYPEMTAKENLVFFARLFGVRDFDVEALLRRVGLADRMNDRVNNYSKGMRQRLMVARSLVNTPKLLFLDEPTDGLDPVSSKALREVIREEAARGASVLLTTHDMHEADTLSNRVAFIDKGKLIALDTPENLKQAHGTRAVKVHRRKDGEVTDEVIPLDEKETGARIAAAVTKPGLLSVHTEEATLEEIFIKLAGRGLA